MITPMVNKATENKAMEHSEKTTNDNKSLLTTDDPILSSIMVGTDKICIKTEEQLKRYKEYIKQIKDSKFN